MKTIRKQANVPGAVSDNADLTCIARLRAALQSRSGTSRRAARWVLDHLQTAAGLSIYELAEACDVSTAALTRFCTTMGYSGYRQMQLDLVASLAAGQTANLGPFDDAVSPDSIIQQVFACHQRSLEDTLKLIDQKTLIAAAKRMLKARQVVFAGLGESGAVATVAAQRLTSLGLCSRAATDPYDMIFLSGSATRSDVFVGISHTGQTESVVEAVQAADGRGTPTVAITNYADSPLVKHAKWALLTSFYEHRISAAVSSSRIAQSAIVDSIYFLLGGWCKSKAVALEKASEQRARRTLR